MSSLPELGSVLRYQSRTLNSGLQLTLLNDPKTLTNSVLLSRPHLVGTSARFLAPTHKGPR